MPAATGRSDVPVTKRYPLLLKSFRTASAQLARMPSSPEVEALKNETVTCEGEVQAWAQNAPTNDQRELMMKKALALQVAVTKLARRK